MNGPLDENCIGFVKIACCSADKSPETVKLVLIWVAKLSPDAPGGAAFFSHNLSGSFLPNFSSAAARKLESTK